MTPKLSLLLSIICIQFIAIYNNSLIQSTEVKWSGNNDPNAPEAAKVPRSQKYWDENNIERPDYAKTDAEIAKERRSEKKKQEGLKFEGIGDDATDSSSKKKIFRIIIGVVFVGSWIGIYQFGMGQKGTRLGSVGSNSSSNQSGHILNYAMKMKKQDHESLEDKARKARLARFENKTPKED